MSNISIKALNERTGTCLLRTFRSLNQYFFWVYSFKVINVDKIGWKAEKHKSWDSFKIIIATSFIPKFKKTVF